MRAFVDFPDGQGGPRLVARFEQPLAVLGAWTPGEVVPLLKQVQAHAEAGRWCVGGLAYEAAPAFDRALAVHAPTADWPLARFGVFAQAHPWSGDERAEHAARCSGWHLSMEREPYARRFDQVTAAMAAGECLQVNLTAALGTRYEGEPAHWMARLRRHQPDAYLLWLDCDGQQVLSASPELFFHWDRASGEVICRPMKGTAPRHADAALDDAARRELAACAKERAENVMIADLLRSDLGRIARLGSVRVAQPLEVQALPTVWQMTTTVTARTREGVDLADVFRALFPCGSVTGAPKSAAMRWIRRLEGGPRGVYCGAAGVVRPGGTATFNVPIRTVQLSRSGPTHWDAHYGVGSGLTVYAKHDAEWQELAVKARLAQRSVVDFRLLETLRLERGRYWLLEGHLRRLAASASHFGFACDLGEVTAELMRIAEAHAAGLWRVRLTLGASGIATAEASPLEDIAGPVAFAVCDRPFDSNGHVREFVQHKTTRREHYEAMHAADAAWFDTLLVNARGELTEFTRGNVALRRGGRWLTPPLSSGLLAGVYREQLLAACVLSEQVLRADDLRLADEIAFFNSLRGWIPARVVDHRAPGFRELSASADASNGVSSLLLAFHKSLHL